jgi:hypothetical protein
MDQSHHLPYVLLPMLLIGGCGGTTPGSPTPLVDMSNGQCNQIAIPTASITITAGTGSLPTASGGTIVDGTYTLTASTDYSVGDALVGQATAGVMVVANGTIQSVSSGGKGGTIRVNANYTVSGTNLQQTGSCGFSESLSEGFSATATTITLIQATPPIVSVFSR